MPNLDDLRATRAKLEASVEQHQRELGPEHPDLAGE
jgi:hypothetical protein